MRWGRGPQHLHCGHCVPCIIRQAAFIRGWGPGLDPTGYRLDIHAQPLNTDRAEGEQVRAFQYAVERIRGRPEIARLLIHKPGPLTEDTQHLSGLTDVYVRGMREVGELLNDVTTYSPKAEAA
jgi:hypothetical protein